jgi:carbon monoxide dehydrogenase subunit G
MKNFSASVIISRPVDQVFEFLNNQRNHATLNQHNFRDYRVVSPQSSGTGARAQFVLKTGAFQEQVEIQVVQSDPPHQLVEEGQLQGNPFRVNWQLTPLGPSQTRVELTTEYQVGGAAALFGGVIQKAFVRIYGRLLADLEQKLAA